jgi:hypothetical protein
MMPPAEAMHEAAAALISSCRNPSQWMSQFCDIHSFDRFSAG